MMLRVAATMRTVSAFLHARIAILSLSAAERSACKRLRAHGLFDAKWYLLTYPDVRRAKVDPLHHFVRHGVFEGRLPDRACRDRRSLLEEHQPHGPTDKGLGLYNDIVRSLDVARDTIGQAPQRIDKGRFERLSDRHVSRGLRRFRRFPLFDEVDYLGVNEELRSQGDLVVIHHAFASGLLGDKPVFGHQTIANEIGRVAKHRATGEEARPHETPLNVSIVFNTSSGAMMQEIATSLADDLVDAGHDVRILTDHDDPTSISDHNIIVAPHEFFLIGQGTDWICDDVMARSVMYNTERPQNPSFGRGVAFGLLSRGVVDLTPQTASIFTECLPAIHCTFHGRPLPDRIPDDDDPIVRVLPTEARVAGMADSAFESRCIDVSFFGTASPHRDRFLSQTARFFSDYKTVFYCRRADAPTVAKPDLVVAARHVAFHSKIALNIHRDEFGFLEWHRIVKLGMEAGALVVSEPCLPSPDLEPNVHYFEESGRHIQNLVEWLIKTPDGRMQAEVVRGNARAFVKRRRDSKESGRQLAAFLSRTYDANP